MAEPFNKEAVYDAEIAPLMTKIIAICKEHQIPMVASFEYATERQCTTSLPFEERGVNKQYNAAVEMIRNGLVAMTIRSRP